MTVLAAAILLATPCETSWSAEPQVFDDWRQVNSIENQPLNAVRTVCVDEGRVWVGTDHGLAAMIDDQWHRWSTEEGLADYPIAAIAVDPRTQDVWLGTWGGGLVRFSAGRFDRFHQFNSGIAGNLVTSVIVNNGRVWAATNGGINEFDPYGEAWTLHHGRHARRSDVACVGLSWQDGGLLAGLQGVGLARLEPGQATWHAVWPTTGDVSTAERGRLIGFAPTRADAWLVTATNIWHAVRGARRGSTGAWSSRPAHGVMPPHESVTCLAASPQGELWLGTEDGLRVIAEANNATVLTYGAGTDNGYIARADGAERREAKAISTTPPIGDVRCIAFDDTGVWVGTDGALFHATRRTPWNGLPPIALPTEADTLGAGQAHPPTADRKPAIAVYGPRNRTIAIPGEWDLVPGSVGRIDLLATQLAIEGTGPAAQRWRPPIKLAVLTPGYAAYGWGLPEDDIVYFASRAEVAGIVGHMGGHDRYAERAIRFARIPFVTFATDQGDLEAPDHPWVFRCYGSEPGRHQLLVDHLIDEVGIRRPAVLYLAGRESQPRRAWWRNHAARRGHPLVAEIGVDGRTDLTQVLSRLTAARPDAILTWEDEDISVEWLRQLRGAGSDAVFVGGPAVLKESFAARAGGDAGRVIAGKAAEDGAGSPELTHFANAYAERNVVGSTKVPPDGNAYGSYDATRHLLEAVRAAGSDRNGVREILRLMRDSALGEAHHERLHGPGSLVVGHLAGGRWTYRTLRRTQ